MISYLSFLVYTISDLFVKTHLICRQTCSFFLKASDSKFLFSLKPLFLALSGIHIIQKYWNADSADCLQVNWATWITSHYSALSKQSITLHSQLRQAFQLSRCQHTSNKGQKGQSECHQGDYFMAATAQTEYIHRSIKEIGRGVGV